MNSYLKSPYFWKSVGLFAGPLAFLAVQFFATPVGLSEQGIAVMAVTLWMAIWWISEALPMEVTSLLPIVLFPLTGGLTLSDTTASYGHKFIFLFAGGFMLSIALERWNLHRRIALNIIRWVGSGQRRLLLGFMVAVAFMSMWISNTATTVMMLPVALAVIRNMKPKDSTFSAALTAPSNLQNTSSLSKEQNSISSSDKPQSNSADHEKGSSFGTVLLLGLAYAASIGGMASLIGTPPNLIFAGVVEETTGIAIGFTEWMSIGLPISVVLLLLVWWVLGRKLSKIEGEGMHMIREEIALLGPMKPEEKRVAWVFGLTAMAWMLRSQLLQQWIPALDDTIIAITAGILLFVVPNGDGSRKLLTWKEAVGMPWGVLMLFGGGIAIASAFDSSGLSTWIGGQFIAFSHWPLFALLLITVWVVNFLTEITSNLATTAAILPLLAPLAVTLDVHPFLFMVGATTAASCAFMLPVATAPNALVFGSGELQLKHMVRYGLVFNLISVGIITLAVYYLLPLIWGLQVEGYPF